MCNQPQTPWQTLMDLLRLIDTAYGLAVLADYELANSLQIAAEKEAATSAPMSAARLLLAQAAELANRLEPILSKLDREAA